MRKGRVEVCAHAVWGTVCNHMWGVEDASVACKQLGFSGKCEQYECLIYL